MELPENASWLRRLFIRQYFKNHAETLDFYLFLLKLGRLWGPIDWVVKEGLGRYMSENLHSTVVLPLEEMMEVIDVVKQVSVSRCICRVHYHNCSQDTWTCLFVNSGAEEHAKVENRYNKILTKEEAKDILKRAYDKGLVVSLDWCVYPYTYGACCCCRDCCVPMRMRLDYGLGVAMTRTHQPVMVGQCTNCRLCVSRCISQAITLAEEPEFDQKKCIGCGQCSYICPEGAIQMQRIAPIFQKSELSTLRLGFNFAFFTALVLPGLLVYILVNRIILSKYPRDEFTEHGTDAHSSLSVHEYPLSNQQTDQ